MKLDARDILYTVLLLLIEKSSSLGACDLFGRHRNRIRARGGYRYQRRHTSLQLRLRDVDRVDSALGLRAGRTGGAGQRKPPRKPRKSGYRASGVRATKGQTGAFRRTTRKRFGISRNVINVVVVVVVVAAVVVRRRARPLPFALGWQADVTIGRWIRPRRTQRRWTRRRPRPPKQPRQGPKRPWERSGEGPERSGAPSLSAPSTVRVHVEGYADTQNENLPLFSGLPRSQKPFRNRFRVPEDFSGAR